MGQKWIQILVILVFYQSKFNLNFTALSVQNVLSSFSTFAFGNLKTGDLY